MKVFESIAMVDEKCTGNSNVLRSPVHDSIRPEQISKLVDQFYARALEDERLGPIFNSHIDGTWPEHLKKMKSFWRSVLLRTGEYKGKPVPVHTKLPDITTQDFQTWLHLFQSAVEDNFCPPAQPLVIEASQRIASSLWLACAENPFASPPDWSRKQDNSKNSIDGCNT